MIIFDEQTGNLNYVSQAATPTKPEERKPNRQERRYAESLDRRYIRKVGNFNYRLKQFIERPTAHLLFKQRPGCFGKAGKENYA